MVIYQDSIIWYFKKTTLKKNKLRDYIDNLTLPKTG